MSLLRDEDLTLAQKSNVFYDSFKEVVESYADEVTEVWEEAATICLADTSAETGLFPKSDIIIVYDKDTAKPMIVTERIFKKNYSRWEWFKMKSYLRHKLGVIKSELGFNIKITFSREYLDYVHYKEEWWQWAQKHASH
ncbi:MAG: hypothetical protein NC489_30230 [Ruminococcus flavefaciens]|nr:hypothetical protein [Ruminococcus flavefaciens]